MMWLPYKIRWRRFKFRLKDNSFIDLPIIKNEKKLKYYINKFNPVDIYYSAGMFLNPHKIDNPNYMVADNLFFKVDICIDLDDVEFEEVKKTCKVMKNYKRLYILQTSDNSYQIVYKAEKLKGNTINERKDSFKASREKIITLLKENNIKADFPITNDYKRVIRLPLTKHRTGFFTKFINDSSLVEDSRQSRKAMNGSFLPSKTMEGKKGKSANPALLTTKASYITNRCKKRRVLFLLYSNIKLKEILKLQKIYNTGTLWIFYYPKEEKYGLLSLKVMDIERIRKIAKYSTAINKKNILKNNTNWIRISSIVDLKGNTIASRPIKLISLKCPSKNMECYSRFHVKFLNYIGFNILKKDKKPIVYTIKTKRRRL